MCCYAWHQEETSTGGVWAYSELIGCPVECRCLAKAKVAKLQLRSDLWCSLYLWLRALVVSPTYVCTYA